MKKNFLTTCVKLSVLAGIGYGAYLYACGGDGMEDYYNSVFSPEIAVGNTSYKALFLSEDSFFYGGYIDIDEKKSDQLTADAKEWRTYLAQAKQPNAESWLSLFFNPQTKREQALEKLGHIQQKEYPKRIQNFVDFLRIAVGNEGATNIPYDPWNYENRKVEKVQQGQIQEADNLYASAQKDKDAFFANRMWFQAMRLRFYSYDRSAVIAYFEQTHRDQPKNALYYRALHYVAGAYIAQKNYRKANALLATLFHEVPALRQTVTYEYHPLTDNEVGTIAQELPPSQAAALWAMQGYYRNEKEAIEHILALEPRSPYVDFLLTRYINRIENKTNTYDDKGVIMASYKGYRSYTHRVVTKDFDTQWVLQTAQKETLANPYLWHIAAGYLSMFRNDFQGAASFLKKAKTEAKNTAMQDQVRLLETLNEVSSLEQISKEAEDKLLKDIQWLWTHKKNENMRYGYAFSFVRAYLSRLYKEANNTLMWELTSPQAGFYKNGQQSLAMEQLLLKGNKTPWEKFWAEYYTYTLGDIYESRAIYAFYEDNISKAIAELKKVPFQEENVYNEVTRRMEKKKIKLSDYILPANPFNGFIKDCNDCQHAMPQKVKYSKLSFLEKVKEMQEKITKGEDVYNNALLVGNAFYNASYFGSIRAFYYNRIIGEYGLGISQENLGVLLSMQHAKKYYLLAQKHATTDEQRAKMAYLLAKIERNEFYIQTYFSKPDNYGFGADYDDALFKDWKGFQELRNKYRHTQYYKEVIRECGYFRKTIK
ncbi:MAG: hypothetical protein D8H93_24620 [Capnocytophaga sp.]|nr:MAG: hypothetical protein D8H93_24620 [Capnocytophaga sp.]